MASHVLTRRDFSVRLARMLPMMTFPETVFASMKTSRAARVADAEEVSKTNEAIQMEVMFASSPKRVYDALTDAKTFDRVMAASAAAKTMGPMTCEISREVGGAFKIYGGHIIGRHIELIPDKRIVQAWRVVDWDPGAYSIAKFELLEQGTGTKLVFDHTGFPTGLGVHLAEGWHGNYFEPMAKVLA